MAPAPERIAARRPAPCTAPRPRPRRAAAHLLLALLALTALGPALGPGTASHGGSPLVEVEYVVRAEDPALLREGKVQVTWKASGFQGHVSAFCLQTDNHEYTVEDFGPLTPGGTWESHPTTGDTAAGRPECPKGYRAVVTGKNEVQASFTLDVDRQAFSACACEFNSHLNEQWGVIKAEALALPFSYAFFAPQPTFRATVKVLVPPGWSSEAPWKRLGENHYELPGTGTGSPLPRGFFVVGRFSPEHRDETASIGKEFVYVRLAGELRSKDSLFDYLKKATPYYQGVYGDVTGDRILVVSAGPPMFTGGLGSTDSLFVHQNGSEETIAHEYAHVWQRFQTIDVQGQSSIWVNEGDADLHGALSRFVTETSPGFTLAKLNQEFRESYDKHSREPNFQQPLTSAAYGNPFEQVAYKKGMFTLIFLDQEVKRVTNQSASLNEVLRELNAYYEAVVANRSGERRMTNQDVLEVVNRVVQRHSNVDMKGFFDRYVLGSDWPPYREVPAEVPVTFDALTVTPAVAEPGEPITVRLNATNVRDSPQTRNVELVVDDKVVQQRSVTLGPLATVPVSFTINLTAPGGHTARVAYLRQDFRVLTPALLQVEAAEPVVVPQEGVPFELAVALRNTGETAGEATVLASLGGTTREAQVRVPGLGTATARLDFLVAQEATLPVEVVVRNGPQTVTHSTTVLVGPRDRDGDGVPDRDDAFPDNPALSEPSVVNDLRNKAPGVEGVALLAALGAGLLLARRR
jgi:hypothetical protein